MLCSKIRIVFQDKDLILFKPLLLTKFIKRPSSVCIEDFNPEIMSKIFILPNRNETKAIKLKAIQLKHPRSKSNCTYFIDQDNRYILELCIKANPFHSWFCDDLLLKGKKYFFFKLSLRSIHFLARWKSLYSYTHRSIIHFDSDSKKFRKSNDRLDASDKL